MQRVPAASFVYFVRLSTSRPHHICHFGNLQKGKPGTGLCSSFLASGPWCRDSLCALAAHFLHATGLPLILVFVLGGEGVNFTRFLSLLSGLFTM